MIIKGSARSAPIELAKHLRRTDTNELVRVIEARGTLAQDDMRGVLVEMDSFAAGTRCQRTLYHASISPSPNDPAMEPEQWAEAVEALEERLGFTDQPRLVVAHIKDERAHLHVVWSRIDQEAQRAIHDGWNYRAHEEVARDLERGFNHERVQGAHAEREGVERPERTPSMADIQQQQRSGVSLADVRADVTEAFQVSANGPELADQLAERGYVLARGDRRDFVVLDETGEVHSLARRIEGLKAAELRAFMRDVEAEQLPTVADAKANILARQHAQEAELEQEGGDDGGDDEKGKRGKGEKSKGDGRSGVTAAAQRAEQRRQREAEEKARLQQELQQAEEKQKQELQRAAERKQRELRERTEREAEAAKQALEAQLEERRRERGLVTRFLDWMMPTRLEQREEQPRREVESQISAERAAEQQKLENLKREVEIRAQLLAREQEQQRRDKLTGLSAEQQARALREELIAKGRAKREERERERGKDKSRERERSRDRGDDFER